MVTCFDGETISYFFLQSSLFNVKRRTLLNNINETDSPTLGKIELLLTSVLLFGNMSFKAELNWLI